jgi:hypothetical protein
MHTILFLIVSLLASETIEIQPVVDRQEYAPPTVADPWIAIWHNRGTQGMWTAEVTSDKVSKFGGLSVARKQITIDLKGHTVWTDGLGLYGYDGIDGEFATKLLATGKTPESREISRRGMISDFAIPEKVVIRNGTIVAPKFTNLTSEVLEIGPNVTFVTASPVVADDQKLPLTFRALSGVGNEGVLNNVVWSVDKPEMAIFEPRQPNDPAVVRGYLVPVGSTGMVRVTLTGTNTRGQQVTGFLDVEIVGGAVQIVNIEALPPIDK